MRSYLHCVSMCRTSRPNPPSGYRFVILRALLHRVRFACRCILRPDCRVVCPLATGCGGVCISLRGVSAPLPLASRELFWDVSPRSRRAVSADEKSFILRFLRVTSSFFGFLGDFQNLCVIGRRVGALIVCFGELELCALYWRFRNVARVFNLGLKCSSGAVVFSVVF